MRGSASERCMIWTVLTRVESTDSQASHRTLAGSETLSGEVEAQSAERLRITLPVLEDLHVQIEVHGRPQERLDPPPRTGADLLEARAAAADDDRLLAVAFDVDVHVDVPQRAILGPVLPRSHLLHLHGERVGQLVADVLQRGFADQFRHHHGLGLVGEVAVGVEGRRQREMAGQDLVDGVDLESDLGGHGHDVREVAQPGGPQERRSDLVPRDAVRLRHERHHRGAPGELGELLRDVAVAGTGQLVRRHAESDDVDLREGAGDEVIEPLAQERPRSVETGGVDEDQLVVLPVDDPPHRVARGLRLRGRDRDLLAHERVGQRRLARVGPADEACEPGAVVGGHIGPEAAGSQCLCDPVVQRRVAAVARGVLGHEGSSSVVVETRHTCTRVILCRLPSPGSASSLSPAISARAPPIGTLPTSFWSSPPTLETSSSSMRTSKRSARSSMSSRALTTAAPSASIAASSLTSYSSSISPTISSTMSSIVTMPAVPPYSSTTTATWVLRACISWSRPSTSLVSGTN